MSAKPEITLITGGARCGKSTFALESAMQRSGQRLFVATAMALDGEMEKRIEKHQMERADHYSTIEEPYELTRVLEHQPDTISVAVIDCLTVWLGNLYHQYETNEQHIKEIVDEFTRKLTLHPFDIIMVTNEVGWGIIPDNALSRSYRDMAGYVNRTVAQQCDNVFLCACGIPVCIKSV